MFKRNAEHVGIMVSGENIRIAHLKGAAGNFEIVNVARRDITGIAEEEVSKVVKSILNDFNARNPTAICVVASNATTKKNIEIPSVDPQEIKSIINLQAGRHTPYSREEIILDYVNIGVYQRNYSKVLLVIANRSTIKKQLDTISRAGLKIDKVLFASEGIVRFYTKVLNAQTADLPFGIIDSSSDSTDFIVSLHGNIVACRSIPVGMLHLASEGKPAYDRLVGEIKKSVESYQSEDIEKLPASYILTSDDKKIKELQPLIKDALKSEVKIIPYFDNIRINPQVRKSVVEAGDESFLDIIASVITATESRIDLTPEEIRMQHSIEKQAKEVAKTCILTFVIIIAICLLFVSKLYMKRSFLDNLKIEHDPKHQEVQALEKIAEKVGIVEDYLASRLVSLDVINELYRLIPKEIYLRNIILDEKGTITISGISESMSRVFSLVGNLENSALFKGVKTTSTSATKERGKDVAVFELVFKLESAKDDAEGSGQNGATEEGSAKPNETTGKK